MGNRHGKNRRLKDYEIQQQCIYTPPEGEREDDQTIEEECRPPGGEEAPIPQSYNYGDESFFVQVIGSETDDNRMNVTLSRACSEYVTSWQEKEKEETGREPRDINFRATIRKPQRRKGVKEKPPQFYLYCFSVMNNETLEHLKKRYMRETQFQHKLSTNRPIILVGCDVNYRENIQDRMWDGVIVRREEGRRTAEEFASPYIEVDCETGENIQQLVELIMQLGDYDDGAPAGATVKRAH
uniref:Uncharacterized protein n=1 Tax=Paramoeba aestuarina TaxID=180227 RepID=A0A7S4JK86_9EUKA|mmetsp:Transcript_11171/g.16885  ORF Transcript_11171/g.16885 Transcript_11171/m.16885 type:complete len:240 (+) Transcript_11171:65-784(+)|eukprot:CAMPEP_0201536952 /NCGR_PEP_ID=MMETSP0161_2-20130828/63363_1 /ASSEMBLY_ACC=CAM_ASM_000251 /TAXON_ID=180227 /ORGANISM="Neoparamoeba aestuarina, Strain SoJaBio B1-5/56/2" /LENGTH=239 /DNA_ID=CAMNT_0047942967 /DNA_START=54 /DNA_END=773 /DNA_ORIENTATION=+